MSDNIVNASIIAAISGILYLLFNVINIRFVKKEQLTRPLLKQNIKTSLLVVLCSFISVYISNSLTPTIIEIQKPGVIIDEPSF